MKQALITGASSGIGLATANLLLAQGAAVTGIARDFSGTPESPMIPCVLDLAALEQLPTALNDLPELQADFDLLVLNAGYGRFSGLESFSYQQIQHLINTNLTSNLFLLKHFLPRFKQSGGKDIVLMGSESALQGAKQGAAYCASKFAIRGLAQSLRADCANNDIRVMLINPGPVQTDFFKNLNFEPQSGTEFALRAEDVAQAIFDCLQQPRNVVTDEINLQPVKRAFSKK